MAYYNGEKVLFSPHVHLIDKYNEGYEDGYNDGECAGYSDGQAAGWDEGYEDGKKVGIEEGYTDGLTAGESIGYDKGYPDGYNQGIAAQKLESVDWDVIQDSGTRNNYSYAFAFWNWLECDPKHIVTTNGTSFALAFQANTLLQKVNWEKFNLSNALLFTQSFNSCFKLESVDVDLIPTSLSANCWDYTFSGCRELERIQKIVAKIVHNWKYSFSLCNKLSEIRFAPYDADAGIGIGNDISFADSPKLTRESIVSILEALANDLNTDGSTYKTLTFSTDLDFEGKLKDCVFGLIGGGGQDCGNVMENETGTINGVTYTKAGGEITLNGTTTDTTTINLSTTPITFPEWNYYMSIQLNDYYANMTCFLEATVQHSDGSIETVIPNGYSAGAFQYGDVITSIDLVVPGGQKFDNTLCGIGCNIDYLYWLEETLLYRSCWTLVY